MYPRTSCMLSILSLSAVATLTACTTMPGAAPEMPVMTETDILQARTSNHDFAETERRFRAAVDAPGGPEIMAVIDHAANARSAGMELPPTKLFLIGNAEAGTPLIQAEHQMAMELPIHVMIHETEDGRVHVAHKNMPALAARYGITGQDERLMMIRDGLHDILDQASE